MINEQIHQLIEGKDFYEANVKLKNRIKESSLTPDLLALSRQLSSSIRSRCMELSSSRATDGSPEALRLEALLLEVIQINKEGIYG